MKKQWQNPWRNNKSNSFFSQHGTATDKETKTKKNSFLPRKKQKDWPDMKLQCLQGNFATCQSPSLPSYFFLSSKSPQTAIRQGNFQLKETKQWQSYVWHFRFDKRGRNKISNVTFDLSVQPSIPKTANKYLRRPSIMYHIQHIKYPNSRQKNHNLTWNRL